MAARLSERKGIGREKGGGWVVAVHGNFAILFSLPFPSPCTYSFFANAEDVKSASEAALRKAPPPAQEGEKGPASNFEFPIHVSYFPN